MVDMIAELSAAREVIQAIADNGTEDPTVRQEAQDVLKLLDGRQREAQLLRLRLVAQSTALAPVRVRAIRLLGQALMRWGGG